MGMVAILVMWTGLIHVISPYFGGSFQYFAHFWESLPTKISFYILYISLFGISGLPTKIW